jgi:hypothetical protein
MTTTDAEVFTGELVPVDHEPAGPLTLFNTSDPRVALQRMGEIATALADVLERQHLYVTIGGKKHITVEGWTCLGGMTGIVPIVTNVRQNESGDGFVATVEARRVLDGMVVGAADGECSRAEQKWRNRDSFALRGMAQTRATSRALRGPLGMIVVLKDYAAASAEEMLTDTAPAKEEDRGPIPPEHRPTKEQLHRISDLLTKLRTLDPETDWQAKARDLAKAPYEMLTKTTVVAVIDGLEAELVELQAGVEEKE